MTASKQFSFIDSTQTTRTGATVPTGAQNTAGSIPTSPATDVSNIEPAGTAITGVSMPTGGVGLTGWLSAVWSALSGLLKANLYVGGTIAGSSNAVPMYDAYSQPVQNSAWTSATSANTAFTLATAGNDTVVLTAAVSGTMTAGAIIFEGFDGYNWVNLKAPRTDSYITEGTFFLAGSTTHSWQIPVAGYPNFRARLSPAITGSGSVQLVGIVSSTPDTSIVTVGLDPSQPLPAGTNTIGAISNTSFAVTQSGTFTVQPGNTPNATPWLATISQGGNAAVVTAAGAQKVDGSAVTQPVSISAGSALVGKVGIDQTTPGTTNAVYDTSYADHVPAYYQATATTTAQTLATLIGTSIPSWATMVFITPEAGIIRYRCDGTNPTAAVGQIVQQNQSWPLQGAGALSAASIILSSGSGTLSLEFRG